MSTEREHEEKEAMKIEMTSAEAADVLDNLTELDSVWEATHALMQALALIVTNETIETIDATDNPLASAADGPWARLQSEQHGHCCVPGDHSWTEWYDHTAPTEAGEAAGEAARAIRRSTWPGN